MVCLVRKTKYCQIMQERFPALMLHFLEKKNYAWISVYLVGTPVLKSCCWGASTLFCRHQVAPRVVQPNAGLDLDHSVGGRGAPKNADTWPCCVGLSVFVCIQLPPQEPWPFFGPFWKRNYLRGLCICVCHSFLSASMDSNTSACFSEGFFLNFLQPETILCIN